MTEAVLKVGANYDFLDSNFDWKKSKNKEKQIFSLRGGGGSGKTFDALQFIITYCDNYYKWNKSITIGRDQYSDVKKTVLKDFINILKAYGIYNIRNHGQSHPQTYRLYGNLINFTGFYGLGAHGERNNLVYANEILECDWGDIRPLNQRCSELFIADYNPMYTEHWHYDKLERREDCKTFHSTQLMNPFLSKGERDEILGYEPWMPGTYEVSGETIYYKDQLVDKHNHPPPHQRNIDAGTADEYSWKVYGLGLKGSMEGLIFQNVQYIDEWPEDLAYVYGMDFGFTNDPTTLVKVGETKTEIFLELLMYEPTETPDIIDNYMKEIKISKALPITADSSDKYTGENKGTVEMVKSLRASNWAISKVSKKKGIMYWITYMRGKKIYIIKNNLYHFAKKEQESYRFKTVNGIAINQPVDGHDHFWDGARYAIISLNTRSEYFV